MPQAMPQNGDRCGTRTALVMGGVVALAMFGAVPGRDAVADTVSLSTGVSLRGDGEGATDTVWRFVGDDAAGRSTTAEAVRLATGPDLPPPGRAVASGASHWVAPDGDVRRDATGLRFTTKFNLTKSQARAATLDAHWSSAEDAVEVTLNGVSVFRSRTEGPAFEAWHDLKIAAGEGLRDGVNVLEFHLLNPPRSADGRAYFRLEGGVSHPSTVPEPAALILSTASTLILAGLSWKRRLARRHDGSSAV